MATGRILPTRVPRVYSHVDVHDVHSVHVLQYPWVPMDRYVESNTYGCTAEPGAKRYHMLCG